ncbi:MAG: hypothetical protein ACK5PB_23755 [Pirellula sp.]|jgi:hypothetical protein
MALSYHMRHQYSTEAISQATSFPSRRDPPELTLAITQHAICCYTQVFSTYSAVMGLAESSWVAKDVST